MAAREIAVFLANMFDRAEIVWNILLLRCALLSIFLSAHRHDLSVPLPLSSDILQEVIGRDPKDSSTWSNSGISYAPMLFTSF